MEKNYCKYWVFCFLLLASNLSLSDKYPVQPITIVAGFGVGGSVDRMARMMSHYLAKELGQPVNVINKKGAGTLLAANYVLNKPGDGYTVFASAFSPYLSNTILEGHAQYSLNDFSYINFQWFDEDLIALSKKSKYKTLKQLLDAIREKPKTVRACVVRGSTGHLTAKLLLEASHINQENLNLVTYNSGGQARAAVAGGVVDFIVISAKGSESIREYLQPLAIVSDSANKVWAVPDINSALKPLGITIPVLPGSVRGFATSAVFKQHYPKRFALLMAAFKRVLAKKQVRDLLQQADIGGRWIGPKKSELIIQTHFSTLTRYSHLLKI